MVQAEAATGTRPGRHSPTGHTDPRLPRPVLPDVPDPATHRPRSSTTPAELATDTEPIWVNDPYPDPHADRAAPGRHGRPADPPF